jgi:hypothetical protein
MQQNNQSSSARPAGASAAAGEVATGTHYFQQVKGLADWLSRVGWQAPQGPPPGSAEPEPVNAQ